MHKKIVVAVTNDMVTDQRVNRICTSLVNEGVDVVVAARKLQRNYEKTQTPYRVVRFNLLFNKGAVFYANYNIRLFFFLLFQKIDGITSNDLDTLAACKLASIIKRIPIIYDSHEYFTEVPELVNRKKVQHIWTKIEQWGMKGLRYTSTVCQSIADIYAEKYGVQMKVIRNVPFRLKPLSNDNVVNDVFENKRVVIYQGALNLGRGIEKVIDTLPYLDNIIFVIAGGGDIELELKERVEKLNVTDKVYFAGRLPFQSLRNYTLQAHLGISLEENLGLNYYYSLPNKLFDYIQCGVPVLCSSFPETSRIVNQYNIGETTLENDVEKLAKIIDNMLNDKEKRLTWIANCKLAAIDLCWENEVEILKELYRSAGIIR